jgi:glycosyltransferase involved in cell wall biosynthesis
VNGTQVSLYVCDGLGNEKKDSVIIIDGGTTSGGRIWNMIVKPMKALSYAIKNKYDIYHFHDPELLPVGIILSIIGRNVVYDIHDEIDVQIYNKGWIPKFLRPVTASFFGILERIGIKLFSGVVVVNEKMKKKYAAFTKTDKIRVVQNYPILDKHIQGINTKELDRNGFVFVGTISKQRGIDKILQVAKNLDDGYKFNIAGSIPDKKFKEDLAPLFDSSNVNYLGFIEHKKSIELIMNSQAGLMIYQPDENYLNTYPIKLFEYLMCGIPVIASDFPYWKDFFNKYDCGILVDPNNLDEIKNAITWIDKNKQKAIEMGERGRNAVLKNYSWESQFQNLTELYDYILNDKNRAK